MKKHGFVLPLLLILTILCCLGACQSALPSEQPQNSGVSLPATADPANLLRLSFATGVAAGNYYPFGGVLSQIVDEASGYIRLDVKASTASVDNINQLADGRAQLALAQNDVLHYAFHGVGLWQDQEPSTNLSTLMSLFPEVCQIIVADSSGIERVADLAGKRVALGEENSALLVGAKQILTVYGLTTEDVEAQYLSFSDAAEAMKEHKIDALFVTMGTPNTAVMDLQAACEIRLIGLGQQEIAGLIEKYPFYTPYTLSENDYSFLAEPVETIAVQATLAAAKGLEEQVAYDIVKSILENREKIAVSHAKGAFVSPERAVMGLGVDLHPGALRYYREIGVLE